MFENLTNLFINNHGKFQRYTKMQIVALMAFIIFLASGMFKDNYIQVIILIVFLLIIADTYSQVSGQIITDDNKKVLDKLTSIQKVIDNYILLNIKNSNSSGIFTKEYINAIKKKNKMSSLYIDSSMIQLLYDLIPLYQYSPTNYYKLVKGTNNILKQRDDVERYYKANKVYPQNTSRMLKTSIRLKTNVLNNIHDFVYSVPKQVEMYQYISDIIDQYNIYLNFNINEIYKAHLIYNDTNGINTSTEFIQMGYQENYIKGYQNATDDHKFFS